MKLDLKHPITGEDKQTIASVTVTTSITMADLIYAVGEGGENEVRQAVLLAGRLSGLSSLEAERLHPVDFHAINAVVQTAMGKAD